MRFSFCLLLRLLLRFHLLRDPLQLLDRLIRQSGDDLVVQDGTTHANVHLGLLSEAKLLCVLEHKFSSALVACQALLDINVLKRDQRGHPSALAALLNHDRLGINLMQLLTIVFGLLLLWPSLPVAGLTRLEPGVSARRPGLVVLRIGSIAARILIGHGLLLRLPTRAVLRRN